MGYCTGFILDVHIGDSRIEEILKDEWDFEGLGYAIGEDGDRLDDVKWYTHEDDMRSLSKRHPDITFVLYGEGEENDDVWRKYFKNGKMQSCYAKLTFDDFDENGLK